MIYAYSMIQRRQTRKQKRRICFLFPRNIPKLRGPREQTRGALRSNKSCVLPRKLSQILIHFRDILLRFMRVWMPESIRRNAINGESMRKLFHFNVFYGRELSKPRVDPLKDDIRKASIWGKRRQFRFIQQKLLSIATFDLHRQTEFNYATAAATKQL